MQKILMSIMIVSTLTYAGCNNEKDLAGKELKVNSENTSDIQTPQKAATNFIKKYSLKSGIITFQRTGVIGNSEIIVYFDDYGTKERSETYKEDGTIDEVKFSDGENMYKFPEDQTDKTIYIMGSGINGTEMKFEPDPFSRNEKRKAKYEYKKLSNMEIVGKDCEAYSVKSSGGTTTFAGWQGLLLYTKADLSVGLMETIAVEINENVDVDPALFKVPAGYKVEKL